MSETGTQTALEPDTSSEPPFWYVLYVFAIHSIIFTALFILLAVPAIWLAIFVEWLKQFRLDTNVIFALRAGEYLILAADLLFLAMRLGKFLWRQYQTS